MTNLSKWKALLLIYFFMLVFVIVFQGIPPLFGFIVEALEISHAQAGALMSLFALPGIFISIPGGILADIHGSKRVGIASLGITFAGSLLSGLAYSFPMLIAGRIIAGIGALTISIVAPQILSRWFDKKNLGKAMGIFNTAMPLGTILTLNLYGRLASAWGWKMPILLSTAYCLGILILLSLKFPDLPLHETKPKESGPSGNLFSTKGVGMPVWLVSIIWMVYNASSISYLTFAGDYFVSIGYDVSYAAFLTSLFMIGAFILSPVAGYLTDRFGGEEYFIAGGSIALTALLILIPRTNVNPLLLGSLIGIIAAFIPSPVFSLMPHFISPDKLGLGYGVLSTCLNVGVLAGPLLIGFSYDLTKNYLPGFNIMAIFALAGAIIALILRFIMNKSTAGGR